MTLVTVCLCSYSVMKKVCEDLLVTAALRRETRVEGECQTCSFYFSFTTATNISLVIVCFCPFPAFSNVLCVFLNYSYRTKRCDGEKKTSNYSNCLLELIYGNACTSRKNTYISCKSQSSCLFCAHRCSQSKQFLRLLKCI